MSRYEQIEYLVDPDGDDVGTVILRDAYEGHLLGGVRLLIGDRVDEQGAQVGAEHGAQVLVKLSAITGRTRLRLDDERGLVVAGREPR